MTMSYEETQARALLWGIDKLTAEAKKEHTDHRLRLLADVDELLSSDAD